MSALVHLSHSVSILLLAATPIIVERMRRRDEELRRLIDQAYARVAAHGGLSVQAIAIEIGRPAAEVRDWLDAIGVDYRDEIEVQPDLRARQAADFARQDKAKADVS